MNQLYKNLLTLAMVMVILLTIFSIWGGSHTRDAIGVPYHELVARIQSGEVESLTIQGQNLRGKYRDGEAFRAKGPAEPDSRFLAQLEEKGVKLDFEEKDEGGWLQSLLIGWLPMLLIVGLWFMLFRQLQSGGGKAMSFGKSRARLLNENEQRVTFADVAGVDEAKEELEEIVSFLRDPKKFTRLGGRIPKGVLLVGAPGTGKTLLARAIAGEAGVPFFSISGSDFVEMFVGVGASRVRDLFQQGKKHAPCIVFIDEIDAVGRHRGAGLGGGHDEREQTLNQMLVEMDGFESSEGVIIIAATNRPDVLDPAMLRPGRFDRHVVVPRPDLRGREAILRVHARRVLLAPDVDLTVIGRGTPGFSGADLENLVNEAALIAARREADSVSHKDFELAKDKVLMGAERRSLVISEQEKRITAFHEAGHAMVAMLGEHSDPVHKVTIIPRGMALGVTMTLPQEDRHVMSKEQLLARMDHAMGGRAAEEIAFGLVSTGAANDLKQATQLAREMVCSYGMSETLGPIHLGGDSETVFLGRELVNHPQHGPETARTIDAEIKRFLTEAYTRAHTLLSENRGLLDRIARALLERESLTEKDLEILRADGTLPPLPAPEVAAARPPAERARESQARAPAGFADKGIPDPSRDRQVAVVPHMYAWLADLWTTLWDNYDVWRDTADIVVVAFCIYWLLMRIKGTRAAQMALGLLMLVLVWRISDLFGLATLGFLLDNFLSSGLLILIVIFQADIRRALSRVGRGLFSAARTEDPHTIEEIVRAAQHLVQRRVGALIALERHVQLDEFVESGTRLDAELSRDLLVALFQPHSPLHDGAVLVRRGRVVSAGCILPLALRPELSPALGTRHRAALGLTEDTDAIVLVVSEETGRMSLVAGGEIHEDLDGPNLRRALLVLTGDGHGADDEGAPDLEPSQARMS